MLTVRMLVCTTAPFHHLHPNIIPFPSFLKVVDGFFQSLETQLLSPGEGSGYHQSFLQSTYISTYTQSPSHIQSPIEDVSHNPSGFPRLVVDREEEVDLRTGKGRPLDLSESPPFWGLGYCF